MLVSLAARRRDRIITVSAAGEDEIVAGLASPRERIDVIPNGVRRPDAAPSTAGLRERHRLGERPVVLSVATDLPHKNLPVLLDALALDRAARTARCWCSPGRHRRPAAQDQGDAAGVAEDVRLLGASRRTSSTSLYAVADCLVLPTLYEGFGLPVLEAMARCVPVACSDIPRCARSPAKPRCTSSPAHPQIAAAITRPGRPGLADGPARAGPSPRRGLQLEATAEGTLASYRRALRR